jgi:type I restriction enzyme S subunit
MKLKDICEQVTDRISSEKISLDEYVTTDCILQNKAGRSIAANLPPQKCNLTRYKKGDVLIANIRPYLRKIWFADSDGGCSADVLTFRAKNNHIPEFLYALLMQDSFYDYVMKATKGSKMPRGDINHIMNFPLASDNLNEARIGKLITTIDKKIAINRQINRNLEELAKQIYDYWFVQFDFPNEEGKPYKSSGGKMVYNEVLKREIPAGWEIKKISSQIKENIGGDWGKEEPEGNYQLKVSCCRGADLVSMTDLPTRYILNSNSYKLLEENDMIVEISGGSPTQATGRCVLISKEILNSFNNKLICSNFCQALSISDKDYVSYFYYMWKMFYNSDVFFNFEGKTSGIKNFQYDTFVAEKWYFPPKDLAKKFKEIVSQNYMKKCALDQENKHLAALRDELLPLLMNGQVTLNSCLSHD